MKEVVKVLQYNNDFMKDDVDTSLLQHKFMKKDVKIPHYDFMNEDVKIPHYYNTAL